MTTTTTPAATKRCSTCGETRPLGAFHRYRRAKDGRQWRCKECVRTYREANREKAREYKRTHREANPEQVLAYARTYYEANREQVLESRRTYREANPEKVREHNHNLRVRYAARTPEEVAAKLAELRPDGLKRCCRCREWLPFDAFSANRTRADGLRDSCRTCDGKPLLKIMRERDNWEDLGGCVYCGAPFESVDHVIPQAVGGEDVPENLVPACTSCNSSKKDRPLFVFLAERFPNVDLAEALSVFTVQIVP